MEKKSFIDSIIEEESSHSREGSKDHSATNLIKQKSNIHGFGVFTDSKIKHDKFFYTIPLTNIRATPSPNYFKIGFGKYVLDKRILAFINHSCMPNSELVVQQNSIVLRAKRDIGVGEEITLDYCETEEKNSLVFCNCKTEKCRNYFYTSWA